LFYL